jgi:bacterioferritin B
MLISKELNDAINEQIGHEFEASHQYLHIAAYFDNHSLKKAAALFMKQSDEEREHGMKFVKYILDTSGKLQIPSIPAAKPGFSSAEEAVQYALDWELEVTRKINALMDLAIKQNDHLGREFLGWYVTEQLEEVSNMDNLLRVVKQVGEKNMIMLEAYLSHGD